MAAQLRRALACQAALSVLSRALRTDRSMKGNIMRTFYKRALLGTLIAGGITLFGATVANAAETPADPGLLSSVVADNGPVDSLVGDGVVDPLLGDDGAAAPVTDAVASVVDGVTGTTAGTVVTEALTGDDSALNDVGTTVEDLGSDVGQTVTAAAANTDDQVIDGVVADALTDLGGILNGDD